MSSGQVTKLRTLNKYDHYQVVAMCSDVASEALSRRFQIKQATSYFRFLIGIALAVNAYMSHWGFPSWPSNYWIIVFSVVFYYAGSTLYNWLSSVEPVNGVMIGVFKINGNDRQISIKFDDEPTNFRMELLDVVNKKVDKTMSIYYPDYLTQKGYFLEEKFVTKMLKSLDIK